MATSVVISNNSSGATFSGTADAGLRQNAATTAYGSSSSIGDYEATSKSSTDHKNLLLAFPGLANIAAGAYTITNAKIEIFVWDKYGAFPMDVKTNLVLVYWDVATCTWNRAVGGGSPVNWNTAGALGAGTDIDSTAISIKTISNFGLYQIVSDGASLNAAVAYWLANPSLNYGVMINYDPYTEQAGRGVMFIQSEAFGTSNCPKLSFDYEASGGGPTTIEADGSATGTNVTTGLSAAINASVASASGANTSTGAAAAINLSTGSATGTNTTTGVSGNVLPAVGSADGTNSTLGTSSTIAAASGSVVCVSDAQAAGTSSNGSVSSAICTSTVDGISGAIVGSNGSSACVATATGVGEEVLPGADGSVTCTSTVNGVSGAIVGSSGSIVCTSGVTGVGADATQPEIPVYIPPYSANSGTIEENFVNDYGDKKPKFNLKRLKEYNENPIRHKIVEATGSAACKAIVLGQSAYNNTAFKNYNGQLVRSRSILQRSQVFNARTITLDQLKQLKDADIYIVKRN